MTTGQLHFLKYGKQGTLQFHRSCRRYGFRLINAARNDLKMAHNSRLHQGVTFHFRWANSYRGSHGSQQKSAHEGGNLPATVEPANSLHFSCR